MEAYAAWVGIFLCLSQSAMLSGLNLACFSVSRIQLEIEAAQNKEDAIKVLGLRRDANFLLTTILWGNVGVNTLLALLSGSVLGGIAAFLFSTVFITVFAEIIPQAYFSRNALKIASLLSPVVRFYQFLLYPVAKPTAMILDAWLGPEGVHYVREEMLKQYILRSMGMSGSEIGAFEGKGAANFLALDSRRVGDEGSILDPNSIVRLSATGGRLELPAPGTPGWNAFIGQIQASERRWVVLTDSADAPRLLLDADRFLRAAFSSSESDLDLRDYCVEPVVTTNPNDTLEKVLGNAKVPETDSTERGIILLRGKQKRIITHFDVLMSVITVIEGAFCKEFEGARSRLMFSAPASVPALAGGGRKSELGQIVVEVGEEVGVIAAKLGGVMILQRGGQLVEHFRELAGGLVGEPGRVVEDQGGFAHGGISVGLIRPVGGRRERVSRRLRGRAAHRAGGVAGGRR